MKKSCTRHWVVLIGWTVLVLAAGCASMDETRKKDAAVPMPPPIDQPPYVFHRVMEGETLASIAKWYSGDEAASSRLREENAGIDPSRLKKGDIVKVPVSLAIVHNEQPDHSTQPQKPQKTLRKGGLKQSGPTSPAPPSEAPAVFGPK